MNRQLLCSAAIAPLTLLGTPHLAHAGSDDFITSAYMSGRAGVLGTPFTGMDMKFAAGLSPDLEPEPQPGDPFPPPRDWLFEIDGLTEASVGLTVTADESHPNFAVFEGFMTNGDFDFLFVRSFPNLPDVGAVESGLPIYYAINGLDAPAPLPGTAVDLMGYDLAEVTLTVVLFEYVDGVIVAPGFPPAYGYDWSYRIDFYGTAVPAPSAIALMGLAAIRRRPTR